MKLGGQKYTVAAGKAQGLSTVVEELSKHKDYYCG